MPCFAVVDYQFTSFFYTNRDHSLRGPNLEVPQHLYRMLTDYLLRMMPAPSATAA